MVISVSMADATVAERIWMMKNALDARQEDDIILLCVACLAGLLRWKIKRF